jgi:outer membrane protein OmpU
MKTWKKVGLTALAGSLVATSAFAGAVTVSGSANLTYTGNTGANDTANGSSTGTNAAGVDGSRWGLNKTLGFAGSGEMDNGWTVSISTTLSNASSSAISLALDMGDAGSLNYEGGTSQRGIGKIRDMLPSADEGFDNGMDANGTVAGGTVSGRVSGGGTGFHYSKAMDMIEIGVGYSPKGSSGSAAGSVAGAGGGASSVSAFVKIDPMDGLEIGFGTGETAGSAADNSQTNDHSTAYISYVYGPLTVAYQVSEIDTYTAAISDDESTNWGVLYAVNDEMSISYHDHVNEDSLNGATDEEVTGWGASYTVGSMTFKAHRNHGDNLGNAASMESEHTEVGVTFAF